MPQAAGNAVINCIHAAHEKYESNPVDWQQVVEIGPCLLMREDMGRFEEMCEDGLLGAGDYGIFEDWSHIKESWEGYIHIRDGLVSKGEIQETNDKQNFHDNGPYEGRVRGFFLVYHQVFTYKWWLSFCPTELERYHKFEVSLMQVMYLACSYIFFILTERIFFTLVCASGEREQGSGPPIDHWSDGRACQG
jgi:hypothetical protein